MKIPLSWLDEYVKVSDFDPRELAEKLTRSGLQVESIETVGAVQLDSHFVVVEVLECADHPDSDHLHVCKVTDGNEVWQVVCGAPNMRKGIKTAFAKIGALIPEGGFKIKKGKLRGVESFGMCCSTEELKLPDDGIDGIIEFPDSVAPGTLVADAAKSEKPETVFEIEVTWNRPDALSVIGIAREFSAILGRPLAIPDVGFQENGPDVASEISVEVENPAKCPRYTARLATSVKNVPSPEWMAKRLELCAIPSHGLLVDVTNYVMLECGQPMHAFDCRRLSGGRVVVRDAREGEALKTLDGREHRLDPSVLVIADAEKPAAVAGVMGGEASEIAADTDRVLIESALFDCAAVKNSASLLGIGTDSSYRYIRGVDKDLADWASRRAAQLLERYGGAKIAKGVIDVDNRVRPLNPPVKLDFDRARRLIGVDVGNARMVEILCSLGLVCRSCGPFENLSGAEFEIPSWRYDLQLEADLVEEIARVYGLDNIPDTMPSAPSVSSLSDAPFRAHNLLRASCLSLGFTEAMHYSFLSAAELDAFDPRGRDSRLALPDPVSADYGVLRDSLLPQLLASLGRNASAGQLECAKLFEIGRVFCRDASGRPAESERLSLGFVGPVGRGALDRRRAVGAEEAVLWMKGALEELVGALHVGRLEIKPCEHPAFSAGASFRLVVNGKDAGFMGAVSKKLRHPYRINTQLVLAELAVAPLIGRIDALAKPVAAPQFPMVRRDVAFVAGADVTHEAAVRCMKKAGPKELVGIELFDIFESKALGPGRRSLAFSLSFRAADRTLKDEEVNGWFSSILGALREKLGVEVREV